MASSASQATVLTTAASHAMSLNEMLSLADSNALQYLANDNNVGNMTYWSCRPGKNIMLRSEDIQPTLTKYRNIRDATAVARLLRSILSVAHRLYDLPRGAGSTGNKLLYTGNTIRSMSCGYDFSTACLPNRIRRASMVAPFTTSYTKIRRTTGTHSRLNGVSFLDFAIGAGRIVSLRKACVPRRGHPRDTAGCSQ